MFKLMQLNIITLTKLVAMVVITPIKDEIGAHNFKLS